MLIAARNLVPAVQFVAAPARRRRRDRAKQVEDDKKHFAGVELPGHTLGVIGLGKIGSLVADAAIKLGMNVLGYDPEITVDAAWSLPVAGEARRTRSRRCCKRQPFRHAARAACRATRNLINAERLAQAAARRDPAQLLARGHRRRPAVVRGARRAPLEVLRHRLSDGAARRARRRRRAAAPGRLDRARPRTIAR